MNIHESAEDYLETILVLKQRLGMVRSIDIVRELGFAKPSVSVAMKRLRENGYLEMDAEGYIRAAAGAGDRPEHLHPPSGINQIPGVFRRQQGNRRSRRLQDRARHQFGVF